MGPTLAVTGRGRYSHWSVGRGSKFPIPGPSIFCVILSEVEGSPRSDSPSFRFQFALASSLGDGGGEEYRFAEILRLQQLPLRMTDRDSERSEYRHEAGRRESSLFASPEARGTISEPPLIA